MAYWLFKTEPDAYSIEQLAEDRIAPWDGIRNYQARNRIRDEVADGDLVLVYHSSCRQPAVVGLARVKGGPRPDPTQFDPKSSGYDARSPSSDPRWYLVDLEFVESFPLALTLQAIKQSKALENMELVNRARLSIQKVSGEEFVAICQQCKSSLHQ